MVTMAGPECCSSTHLLRQIRAILSIPFIQAHLLLLARVTGT
jgi:hypothetical protein